MPRRITHQCTGAQWLVGAHRKSSTVLPVFSTRLAAAALSPVSTECL